MGPRTCMKTFYVLEMQHSWVIKSKWTELNWTELISPYCEFSLSSYFLFLLQTWKTFNPTWGGSVGYNMCGGTYIQIWGMRWRTGMKGWGCEGTAGTCTWGHGVWGYVVVLGQYTSGRGSTGEYSFWGWQYWPNRREDQYRSQESNILLYCPT